MDCEIEGGYRAEWGWMGLDGVDGEGTRRRRVGAMGWGGRRG